jgi:hypothetical protein
MADGGRGDESHPQSARRHVYWCRFAVRPVAVKMAASSWHSWINAERIAGLIVCDFAIHVDDSHAPMLER